MEQGRIEGMPNEVREQERVGYKKAEHISNLLIQNGIRSADVRIMTGGGCANVIFMLNSKWYKSYFPLWDKHNDNFLSWQEIPIEEVSKNGASFSSAGSGYHRAYKMRPDLGRDILMDICARFNEQSLPDETRNVSIESQSERSTISFTRIIDSRFYMNVRRSVGFETGSRGRELMVFLDIKVLPVEPCPQDLVGITVVDRHISYPFTLLWQSNIEIFQVESMIRDRKPLPGVLLSDKMRRYYEEQ